MKDSRGGAVTRRRRATAAPRVLCAVAIPAVALGLLGACTNGGDAGGGSTDESTPAAKTSGATPSASGSAGSSAGSSAASTRPTRSGGINQTVPSQALTSAAPVAIGATARPGPSLTASVASVSRFKATGRGPGEISGPAVKVSFSLENNGNRSLGLGSVTATLTDHAGDPALELMSSPANPFTGSLAAGRTGRATYVFSVATSFRQPATIALQLSSSLRIVQFTGRI